MYNGRRDYYSSDGRYIQSDPIGLQGGISTYAYVYSSPLRYIDSSGLRVLLIGHLAAGFVGRFTNPDSYHLALYLDPDDKCNCKGDWPMTLGAQPSGGKLVAWPDYSGDAIQNATFEQVIPTPSSMTDCEFIRSLIDSASSYLNNLAYSFPNVSLIPGASDGSMGPGQYNSNSFASGVLQNAGVTPPAVNSGGNFQVPGYNNPIPIGH